MSTDQPTPLSVDYNPLTDILVVNGVKYAGVLFRQMATVTPPGCAFRIVENAFGTVTVQSLIIDQEKYTEYARKVQTDHKKLAPFLTLIDGGANAG